MFCVFVKFYVFLKFYMFCNVFVFCKLVCVFKVQELGADIEQQLWTNNERLLLKRPFFELRIFPVLPKDNGEWICILETDPLFAEELPLQKAGAKLLVLEKPPIPPKPFIQFGNNKNSVLLDWSKGFSPLPSQQPIIKFAIYISQKFEENIKRRKNNNNFVRVLSTKNNLTNLEIAELEPNTLYSFSVRAENTVGESQFGPEAVFRTFGLPPSKSPEIRSLINSTSADCVELEWQQPVIEEDGEESTSDSILGYRIIVNKLDGTNLKEIYAKGSNTQKQLVCSLEPFIDYSLTLEAHNLFGYSKATKTSFKTEQSIPSGPPQSVQVLPLPGGTSLSLNWRQPEKPNGIIRAYLIHFKEMFSQRPLRQIRLEAKNEEEKDGELFNQQLKQSSSNTVFAFNLTNLSSNSRYKIQISSVTDKGEGPKSEPIIVDTDIAVPQESPKITSLFFDCASSLLSLEWILPQNLLNSKLMLLLDQIQLGEQLTLSVSILLKSKANSSILLETPNSSQEHFVLLANGWKCRFRSSICPPINSITSKSICENFPKSAANQKIQEEIKTTTLIPLIQNKQINNNIKMDANMATIFFIFGTAIALAIFLLFLCMLRSRCPLFKTFLLFHSNFKQQKRRPKFSENGKMVNGQERVSLVPKTAAENSSILLPPITIGEELFSNGVELNKQQQLNNNLLNKNKLLKNNICEETTSTTLISVLEFDDYFEKMSNNENAGFKKLFNEIESETKTSTNLLLINNCDNEKNKNRYTDIGAFPKESRIRLYCTEKERYINANFVDSCDEKHAYIATQAPLPNTFGDFWLMVWQEKCQLLIAIINMVECGFRKCDQYWPEEIGEKILIENFCIKLVAERSNSVFTHRVLEIKNNLIENGEEENIRTIHQLHFMDWPDKGVPSTPFPLLHFINYVADLHCSSQNQDVSSSTPCVVHCSAGIGRSGSFILVDSLRRHLLCCDRIDVSEQLKRMRKQRIQLVQTLEQFVFCHEVLKHLVSNGITRQPRTHFPNYCQFLFTKLTPNGQRRISAQSQTLICNKHIGKELNNNNNNNIFPNFISLAGYHKNEEFIILNNNFKNWQDDVWQKIWMAKCKSLIILDSNSIDSTTTSIDQSFNLSELFNNHQEGGENQQQHQKQKFLIKFDSKKEEILLKLNGEEVSRILKISRIFVSKFLNNPWMEIENLQLKLKNQHRETLAVVELPSKERRPSSNTSSTPFLFCAFQSVACQLEQEDAVDVLLWLASYKHAYCCCWTNSREIEMIYQRVLELVELQQTFC
uniref:Uncharacterized protein n=4 Tax=Meloidogyne TaxID=189290 RepID=A0A6V7VDM0_MELEN|nr:unnamed protein product [Meloidogyne enterolobii]